MKLPSKFILLALAFGAGASEIKHDQQIVFIPTIGWRVENGSAWELEIRGCVYELELRGAALEVLRKAVGLGSTKMSAEEQLVFARRARFFLVDNERGKEVSVRVGSRQIICKKSGADGRFGTNIRLSNAEVQSLLTSNMTIRIEAVLPKTDLRAFTGEVALVDQRGLTVISDIDDTIKVSEVLDRSAMLRNTFLKPFIPAPGMAALYSDWAKEGAQFHYASASPAQLFLPLADFVQTNGFPAGTFHLKAFRWKDQTFFSLFSDPVKYKLGVLEPLFEKFPQRHFVLVGDSGERDPETYGTLARKYPKQVIRILIRDVTGTTADAARYKKAFHDLPDGRWQIFREPAEISPIIRQLGREE